MKTSSYVLFEQLGCVFETHCPDPCWFAGEETGGRRLGEKAPDLNEIVLSLCFVMPPLPTEAGSYSVIELSRDFSEGPGDLSLQATYDARGGAFAVRIAVGDGRADVRVILLEDLPRSIIAGRVLRLLVIGKHESVYASVESEDDGADISVSGEADGPGAPLEPWGASASGLWQLTSGGPAFGDTVCGGEARLAFPPGFALSDVQVIVYGDSRKASRYLPYSGALDHLTCSHDTSWHPSERVFGEELTDVAQDVHRLACEMESWLRRTHQVSDRLEALAQLPVRLVRSLHESYEEGGDVNPY